MKSPQIVRILSLALVSAWSISASAELCTNCFTTVPPAEMSWRTNSTQKTPSGAIAATSAAREKDLQATKASMESFILNFTGHYGHGDTPVMEFRAAEDGVSKVSYLARSYGLNGDITKFQVSGIGAQGTLKGTLLLPVSGHTGNANARAWAVSDTYSIRMDVSGDAQGTQWKPYYNERALTPVVGGAKSLDLVTAQEIEIPMNKGHVVRIYYFRSGSGGPGGYIEGRVMDFVWDGT